MKQKEIGPYIVEVHDIQANVFTHNFEPVAGFTYNFDRDRWLMTRLEGEDHALSTDDMLDMIQISHWLTVHCV